MQATELLTGDSWRIGLRIALPDALRDALPVLLRGLDRPACVPIPDTCRKEVPDDR